MNPGASADAPSATGRPLVIGLAGGIGAGKSAAASALRDLGCAVIDSDAEARAALDRPDVRRILVGWWGARVLGRDGRIDRAQVARVVFADANARQRLEALIHPLVKRRRADFIEHARVRGVRAVVVDAPLLFEAGVNGECDAVIFVDAPRDLRLERVRQTRGWDESELARREAAQWPIERKRALSSAVVENAGDLPSLRAALALVLARLLGGS